MASPLLSPKSLLASRNLPVLIATTVSVGAHGLFFMAAPLLSAGDELPEEQESVPVVALSPEESLRLPNELLNKPDPFATSESPVITQDGDQLLPVPGLPSYGDLAALPGAGFDGPLQTSPPVFGNPADFFPPLPSNQETVVNIPSPQLPDNALERELERELEQKRQREVELKQELDAERLKREAAEREAELRRLDEEALRDEIKRKEEWDRQVEEARQAEEATRLAEEERLRKEQQDRCAEFAGSEQTIDSALTMADCENKGIIADAGDPKNGANPPDDGEQNPPDDGEQNQPDDGEQNPPDDGEQNPPDAGEQNPPDDVEAERFAQLELAYTPRKLELPGFGQLVADGTIDLEAIEQSGGSFKTKADGSGKVLSAAFPDPDFRCPADAVPAEFHVVVPSDTEPVQLFLTESTGYDPLDQAAEAEAMNQLPNLGWETAGIYTLAIEFLYDAKNCPPVPS